MPKPFVRLDPSHSGTAAFLRDTRALSVWEMLRRFGKPATAAAVATTCALPRQAVQAALDQACELGIAQRTGTKGSGARYRAVGEQLMIVADHSSAALRRLLSEGFANAVGESRRLIDASMAESTKRWNGMQVLHQMNSLALDDAEARELMELCEALRSFIDRSYEKHEKDPHGSPRRCNYHLAIHLAPMHSDELPSPRVQFVEQSTVAGVESAQAKRAGRVLSPRERTVARLLVRGKTLQDVGTELGISRSTVATLCGRIHRKLGITRRAQLAIRLHALGEG